MDTYTEEYTEDVHEFPTYFTRRSESFLDVCFLALPTLVVIQILVPTLGFLYSTECYWEHASSALSIDIIGHQ
jgi:fumarate reductase subunit C